MAISTWGPFSGGDNTSNNDHDRTRVLRKSDSTTTTTKKVMLGGGNDNNLDACPKVQCPQCRCPSCDGSKKTYADETHGQVTVKTPLGRALYNLAKDPSIHLVMETGTLDGTGASRCLMAGLKESGNGRLITIEAMKDWYEAAVRNLAGEPATVIFGTPVDASEMPTKDQVRSLVEEAKSTGASSNFFPHETEWSNWW